MRLYGADCLEAPGQRRDRRPPAPQPAAVFRDHAGEARGGRRDRVCQGVRPAGHRRDAGLSRPSHSRSIRASPTPGATPASSGSMPSCSTPTAATWRPTSSPRGWPEPSGSAAARWQASRPTTTGRCSPTSNCGPPPVTGNLDPHRLGLAPGRAATRAGRGAGTPGGARQRRTARRLHGRDQLGPAERTDAAARHRRDARQPDHRERPYARLTDLLEVEGIGPATSRKLKPLLRLNAVKE